MRLLLPRISLLPALIAWAWPLQSLAVFAAGAAAEIIDLQGQGDQRTASAAEWRPARQAQMLSAGDFVRTRDAARMALVFADETQLRLHQNTVLQVKTIATAGQPHCAWTLAAPGRRHAARPAARCKWRPLPPPPPSGAQTGTSA